MGYEMGIGERRLFIDDDGSVWESPHKKNRLADSIAVFEGNTPEGFKEPEPEPEVEKVEEPQTNDEVPPVCDICGFKASNEHGLMVHTKRKHKVI